MNEPFRPRRQRQRTPGVAFATTAAVALLVGIVVVLLVVQLTRSGTVKSQLGDRVFDAGRAGDLYREVIGAGRSGPILFQALLGDHDIYLQHQGTDANKSWLAFDADAPEAARTCTLRWSASTNSFSDPCTGRTFPADGTGLRHYPTTVNTSHHVIVDLRQPIG